jgi:hypothetical protein
MALFSAKKSNKAARDNGAIGATFVVTRGLQFASLITIIGMITEFITDMVTSDTSPPDVLIGTLVVVSRPMSFGPFF